MLITHLDNMLLQAQSNLFYTQPNLRYLVLFLDGSNLIPTFIDRPLDVGHCFYFAVNVTTSHFFSMQTYFISNHSSLYRTKVFLEQNNGPMSISPLKFGVKNDLWRAHYSFLIGGLNCTTQFFSNIFR